MHSLVSRTLRLIQHPGAYRFATVLEASSLLDAYINDMRY